MVVYITFLTSAENLNIGDMTSQFSSRRFIAFGYLSCRFLVTACIYDIRYLPCRLEKMVIDEINRLSAEYLDKDELEQNIEFCNNLQGQKKG